MSPHRPLANITANDLEPLWSRLDIPTRKIAEALGVTRAGLSYKAIHSLGLPPRTGNQAPNTKGSDEAFTRMWMAGVNVRDMARAFGYAGHQQISTRRANMGLPARTRSQGEGRGPWQETISIEIFWEMELAQLIQENPL